MGRRSRHRLWKFAVFAASASAGFLGLVAVAHTDWGRPLLGLLPSVGGCPADLDNADPQAVDAFRMRTLRSRAGHSKSATAPAWRFELGATTKREIQEWAQRQEICCESKRSGSVMDCTSILPDDALPIASAHFQFDAEERLVALDLLRQRTSARSAVRHLGQIRDDLGLRVGPTTKRIGQLSANHLDTGRFRSAALEYRYSQYLAKLSATNMGQDRILVREQYQWLPEGTS